MSVAMIQSGRWTVKITDAGKNQWFALISYDGRIYKAKKAPTAQSALRWAYDLMRAVDAGIQSDPA